MTVNVTQWRSACPTIRFSGGAEPAGRGPSAATDQAAPVTLQQFINGEPDVPSNLAEQSRGDVATSVEW
jgi:hypothetical protein